jgi:hypothetical protein
MSEEMRMTCEHFEELLHDMDRPGTAGLEMRERALAHAEACGHCGLLMIESESLDFALHGMSLDDSTDEASPHVEATLLREFRQRHAAPKARMMRWQMALGAVAAVALLALGLVRGRITPTTNQPTANNGSHVAATSQMYAVVNDPQLNELVAEEDGTEFVALPYADEDAAAIEGGAVVRVTMPRAALISMGLPISSAIGDQIPAEVVVSADGTPQAIRLISQATED